MFGIWQAYNWEDYFRYTKQVALGLLALGLKRGENIGIISDNHPEWLFGEMGLKPSVPSPSICSPLRLPKNSQLC